MYRVFGIAAVFLAAGCSGAPVVDREAGPPVTIRVENGPIESILQSVRDQTSADVRLGKDLDPSKRISIEAQETPLQEFLLQLSVILGCDCRQETGPDGAEHWELTGNSSGPRRPQ